MRIGVRPDNPFERLLIALNLVPTPLLDSFGMVGARALLVATRIGIFDALAIRAVDRRPGRGPAGHPPGHHRQTAQLPGHPGLSRAQGRPVFVVPDRPEMVAGRQPRSLHDSILMRFVEWDWLDNLIHDVVKRDSDLAGGQMGAMADLYFSLISQAGSWSAAGIAGGQQDAGLVPRRPSRFRTLLGTVHQVAVKP
jgi:hypothetical protein